MDKSEKLQVIEPLETQDFLEIALVERKKERKIKKGGSSFASGCDLGNMLSTMEHRANYEVCNFAGCLDRREWQSMALEIPYPTNNFLSPGEINSKAVSKVSGPFSVISNVSQKSHPGKHWRCLGSILLSIKYILCQCD
ncbi:hypothetical protein DASC09_026850 [Saccharomycopsis crataegensis]|uniref:Uncharacterized protein n=1 Tax=Saccharomycopsis crataegensis TaxID=43959 RepID=A0AAV5QLY7_9ASCO|nr:hypothetical protein DASC09_026850 [Saccharomycopsis crataegensis]